MTPELLFFFHPATLLTNRRTVPPVEAQAEKIKCGLRRPALCPLLFDLPLRGDVNGERRWICLSPDVPYIALIYSLLAARPAPSQAADPPDGAR